MTKRLLISLSIIGAVAAVASGVTYALFNDTETSAGNIFVAGTMDLKVDHLWQTYNEVDCNTCDLTLISNPTNMVVKKNGVAVTSYPAVYVGSNGGFIHSAWTAQNDPQLVAAGAKWIWESDPTRQEDTTQDVTYTFEKTFDWYGPILSSDLWFAIGSDNSIKIWLNGNLIAENPMERGYRQENMLHIPGSLVNSFIVQGNNVLTFEVKNWTPVGYPGTPYSNPGGLIYKFYISGNCQDSYFKQHCMLWGEKDMIGQETFFNFDDVKPGDRGTNLISLHINGNDGFACLFVDNASDGDEAISDDLNVVVWNDADKDGEHQFGEDILYQGLLAVDPRTNIPSTSFPISGDSTGYLGLAWCFGDQTVDPVTGVISCDGSVVGNEAQGDTLQAILTAYATQQRNNEEFTCDSVILQ